MKSNIYCHRRLSHPHAAEGYSKPSSRAPRSEIALGHFIGAGELELIHRRPSRSTAPEPGSSSLTSQERCHGRQRHEPRSADLAPTSNHDLEFPGIWRSITKHTHHSEHRSPISFSQV